MRTKREATEVWVYQYQRTLDFILPGKPVEKSYIESFNDHAGRILYFDLVCFCGHVIRRRTLPHFGGVFVGQATIRSRVGVLAVSRIPLPRSS